MKPTATAGGLVRGRFAPSPTGLMHLGNAFAALLAWLHVRSQGGCCVLRMEDLDPDRCQTDFTQQVLADLHWLGLDWDEGPDVGGPHGPYLQSERGQLYQGALVRLAALGLAYPCHCSRQDIRRAAGAPHQGEEGPRYPGTCRPGPGAAPAAPAAHHQQPAWRFRAEPGRVAFTDAVQGLVEQDVAANVGDFVIWRREDVAAYQLAVVVDDAAMGITHVLRGADLVDSTPRQLLLYASLGCLPPQFAHVPLLLGPDGQRLAKRHGPVSLAELRGRGVAPQAIVGRLAQLAGLIPKSEPLAPAELIGHFSVTALRRSSITVSSEQLQELIR